MGRFTDLLIDWRQVDIPLNSKVILHYYTLCPNQS